MFLTDSTFIQSDIQISKFFETFKDRILGLTTKHLFQEDYFERGNYLFNITDYYLAMVYGMIIAEDFRRKGKVVKLSKIKDGRNFEEINKCFKAKGISLDEVLTALEVVETTIASTDSIEGIEDMEISNTLIVFPFEETAQVIAPEYTSKEIEELLNNTTTVNTFE